MIISKTTLPSVAPRRGNEHTAQGNALGVQTAKETIALKGQKIVVEGFCPFRARNDEYPNTQGVALGYVLLAFQAVRGIFSDIHTVSYLTGA